MPKQCVFCGTSLKGSRTREHVFPRWLLRERNLADVQISPTHWRVEDRTAASVRRHTLNNLVTSRVCGSCNNGWMSELEIAAQPILLPLMSDDRARLDSLS